MELMEKGKVTPASLQKLAESNTAIHEAIKDLNK
jgi:hypothetical protein